MFDLKCWGWKFSQPRKERRGGGSDLFLSQ